jgi:hypothetical protein
MGKARLAVDLAPVADAHDQNADKFVFDTGNNSVIADAIFPEVAELGTFQRVSDTARIF